MDKISEKVDLSEEVLEINIKSPIFDSMLHDELCKKFTKKNLKLEKLM